jgi:hypothetical protein
LFRINAWITEAAWGSCCLSMRSTSSAAMDCGDTIAEACCCSDARRVGHV